MGAFLWLFCKIELFLDDGCYFLMIQHRLPILLSSACYFLYFSSLRAYSSILMRLTKSSQTMVLARSSASRLLILCVSTSFSYFHSRYLMLICVYSFLMKRVIPPGNLSRKPSLPFTLRSFKLIIEQI